MYLKYMAIEITEWIDRYIEDVSLSALYIDLFFVHEKKEGIDCVFISSKENGIEIVSQISGLIVAIHLFAGNDTLFSKFKGALPYGLNFDMSRANIQDIFGAPKKSGGGYNTIMNFYLPEWDKYLLGKHSLHFQYGDQRIEKIGIGSLTLE